jgi:hypothetical protein
MPKGLYIYCILDDEGDTSALNVTKGINDGEVYTVNYRALSAAVSEVPFKEIAASMENVVSHNRVVEAAKDFGSVLPVRFGVIFRNKEGAIKFLRSSYNTYKSKLDKLRGKDELGLKILLEKEAMGKIERVAQQESEEARKLVSESLSAGEGASYFMKLKLEDVVRSEALKKIGEVSARVHDDLTKLSEESRLLKTELDLIVLNSVYLVTREKIGVFNKKIAAFEKKYEPMGFSFHSTGPWAPYSFC